MIEITCPLCGAKDHTVVRQTAMGAPFVICPNAPPGQLLLVNPKYFGKGSDV